MSRDLGVGGWPYAKCQGYLIREDRSLQPPHPWQHLCFPNEYRRSAAFPVLSGHLCILDEVSVHVFCRYFSQVVCLLNELREFFIKKSFIRETPLGV